MRAARVTAHAVDGAARLTRAIRQQAPARVFALTLAAALGLAVGTSSLAGAQTFTLLYTFAGYPADGSSPLGGLLMDAAGNLYGTTRYGGNNDGCHGDSGIGCGAVFKLDTNGVETVLHNFTGPDGANPSSSLIMDATGDLYGTTEFGGLVQNCVDTEYAGCGVVFKLSGKKETVLHRFTGGADGAFPWRGLVMDTCGALYGTTYEGGYGDGVVFKLAGKKETVLHSFRGYGDGADPTAGLIIDAVGNLYGTASYGGNLNCDSPSGCGVVFKLAGRKETTLYAFKGYPDGDNPYASLFMDAGGNLYSTTADGGTQGNLGTVFEVSPGDKESVLYRFKRDQDGFAPTSAVVRDAYGNLYGTTLEGGGSKSAGVVYEITADGKEKILHDFCSGDCSDGAYPYGNLIMDASGNLYGTAAGGGNGNGTIFMITP